MMPQLFAAVSAGFAGGVLSALAVVCWERRRREARCERALQFLSSDEMRNRLRDLRERSAKRSEADY